MNVVVPDASVILKWALPSCDEPDADQAQSAPLTRGQAAVRRRPTKPSPAMPESSSHAAAGSGTGE